MEFNFWCASGAELATLATTIAIYLSEIYDSTDLNTISNFIETLGDAIGLMASQKNRCENSTSQGTSTPPTVNNQFKQ